MQRCSASLVIRKMQIKATMRYHFTLFRMTIITKSTNSKCWWGCGEKGTLVHSWWGCKLVQPLLKRVWNFFKKLEMEPPFYPVTPLLRLYTEHPEISIQKSLCTLVFIAVFFTITKCWKQPRCPLVNEWIKKLWYIYTMEYYEAEWKKELLPLMRAWRELESIMLSEISQAVRDKYHMISPVSGT